MVKDDFLWKDKQGRRGFKAKKPVKKFCGKPHSISSFNILQGNFILVQPFFSFFMYSMSLLDICFDFMICIQTYLYFFLKCYIYSPSLSYFLQPDHRNSNYGPKANKKQAYTVLLLVGIHSCWC
ncbi:hypothetical protein ACHQM5_008427 [Ranunculus cassubicifolius]